MMDYPEREFPAITTPNRPIEGPTVEPSILRTDSSNDDTRAIDKEGYAYRRNVFLEGSCMEHFNPLPIRQQRGDFRSYYDYLALTDPFSPL